MVFEENFWEKGFNIVKNEYFYAIHFSWIFVRRWPALYRLFWREIFQTEFDGQQYMHICGTNIVIFFFFYNFWVWKRNIQILNRITYRRIANLQPRIQYSSETYFPPETFCKKLFTSHCFKFNNIIARCNSGSLNSSLRTKWKIERSLFQN